MVEREEFEEAAHKREHENQLRLDQLNVDLLSQQLRVNNLTILKLAINIRSNSIKNVHLTSLS